jgi:hypothetical protein
MPEWQLFQARLSVFVSPDTVVPETLWRKVVGDDPEKSLQNRSTLMKIQSGPLADGILSLQTQPIRIDWIYQAEEAGSKGATPPLLGRFPAAADPLIQLGRRWATSNGFPSATRLALGFILLFPTTSRQDGYQGLRQFIDGVPNAPDATDFLYQVNRPRAGHAGIEGLQVNRLSKWSVSAFRLFAVSALGAQLSQFHLFLQLELDISTGADFQGVIPGERVGAVIDDLLSASFEISELGTRF